VSLVITQKKLSQKELIMMSEMEAYHYCPRCDDDTIHMFSGSGTKGCCMKCGANLNPKVKANLRRAVSYNG